MSEFDTSHVKNIVLLGHSGSGKTTLSECMLFEAGLIPKRGSIEDKSTISDYHELEKERGNSIFSTLLHTKWRGFKINIIDTPGLDDFVGEVLSALRVADTGIMLINAAQGIEVGTDIIWEYTDTFKTPMILAINQLDHEKADYEKSLKEAKSHFGNKVVAVQYPLNAGEGFNCIVDVLRMIMYEFPTDGGKPKKIPIPASEKVKAENLHKELVETIAGNDEQLMEIYFEKGELTEDEMKLGLKKSMIQHDIFPVFCLSGLKNMGSGRLMGFIDNVCPSANEMNPQPTQHGELLPCDANSPTVVFIYKTISEPHVGELSFFKVFSGKIKAGMDLVNETNGTTEKFNQLFVVEGNKRTAVNELEAGDIGATMKLKNTHVNNTLHSKGKNIELLPINFPSHNMSIAIEPTQKGDDEKLAIALHQIQEEDATIKVEVSPELKQTIIFCQGELHLAITKWKLEHLYKIDVKFSKTKIPYRETIRKMAEANYKHKKQSGGSGQFAEVFMRIEPWYENMPEPKGLNVRGKEEHILDWGGKLVFYNCIVGGAIDTRFLPSILKGVMEKMHNGPLTGSYVRDVRVCIYDGKMHPVDSNDISFKIAGLQAFRQAFQMADPQLLEPLYHVETLCPDELTGNVISDLQTRRCILEGMDTEGHFTKVIANVPLAELDDYSSSLKSITQGRAKFKMHFKEYAPVSFEIQKKLTEEYLKHAHDED
jgi:elongation factor G